MRKNLTVAYKIYSIPGMKYMGLINKPHLGAGTNCIIPNRCCRHGTGQLRQVTERLANLRYGQVQPSLSLLYACKDLR